ncbi:hypothetical protein HYFRA_00003881 [Hymenoscyphus fraxineus]|uniref:Mmc1 C-terminal domain-containing protein n=1 Tax=Hymenoscyphus fraxineus TaxID=746836 RepID=A0A9N9PUR7_9HELO|nr:hypothetical protein HYFRA_00003881 [Hymenoscyphus fraxineus]
MCLGVLKRLKPGGGDYVDVVEVRKAGAAGSHNNQDQLPSTTIASRNSFIFVLCQVEHRNHALRTGQASSYRVAAGLILRRKLKCANHYHPNPTTATVQLPLPLYIHLIQLPTDPPISRKMHDNRPHPLLEQVPLTVSPFVSLPSARPLPPSYKTLPSRLPPSSTGSSSSSEEKSKYVVSNSGHAAHPNDIIKSCNDLKAYIQKMQDDADKELKAWNDAIAARDLAEKRRVAPGWLDSDARILEPEKISNRTSVVQGANLMDVDVSNIEAKGLQHTAVAVPAGEGQGDELDRAFGGLQVGINKNPKLTSRAPFPAAPDFYSLSIIHRMPPRIPRLALGLTKLSKAKTKTPASYPQICPICTFARNSQRPSSTPRRSQPRSNRIERRQQSNATVAASTQSSAPQVAVSPRIELRDALYDLQKHAANYVNISRLQLALRGLEQSTGDEIIRIAILGLADGGDSLKKAKQLVRLLLADPLKAEEEWERILLDEQPGNRPLLLRVGNEGEEPVYSSRMVRELHISSPTLNGHKLEILVLETGLQQSTFGAGENGSLNEMLLVPTMEIPTSGSGRYTPITTPVHKSLIVSKGIAGASSLISSRITTERDIIGSAVDIRVGEDEDPTSLPFQIINVDLGNTALSSFRQSVNNALDYEHDWFASGIPEIQNWLKSGSSVTEGTMKKPVQKLIESLLQSTNSAIQAEQARQLTASLNSRISNSQIDSLKLHLSKWAESAHTELRDHLDIAFNGRRWRKLGWWKLFWRVDDVSMISSSILTRRFLVDAEKEVIFLAGRIVEAGVFKTAPDPAIKHWAYKPLQPQQLTEPKLGSEPRPPQYKDLFTPEDGERGLKNQNWPLHIPTTRNYLSQESVPALQALAQKLVLQTLTTTSLFSVLGGLTYISTLGTTVYEAGAVTALGVVWALRRMQGKWEGARKFWEGEVREEGRKAVRGVEGVVGGVLEASGKSVPVEGAGADEELENARRLVRRAEVVLRDCGGGVP